MKRLYGILQFLAVFAPELLAYVVKFIYEKVSGFTDPLKAEKLKLKIKSSEFYETHLKVGGVRVPYKDIKGPIKVKSRILYTLVGFVSESVGPYYFMTGRLTRVERKALREMLEEIVKLNKT
jgi:hypothetical protein